VSRDGAIWSQLRSRPLSPLFRQRLEKLRATSGLSNLYVWSVSQDKQGKIWASTWGGGIFFSTGDQFYYTAGLENFVMPMAATLQAADGATWVGTVSG